MGITAFDPGVSTGAAVIDDSGAIVETSVGRTLEDAHLIAVRFKQDYPENYVVIEEPPLRGGNYRPHTQQVEEDLRKIFPDATWISPGQWKGTPASRGSLPKYLTQHEKDAVGLARWFKKTRRQDDARSTPSS